jgi:hypothetical protein
MKVSIERTLKVSDEARRRIAEVVDQAIAAPRRLANRHEVKDFIWDNGSVWETALEEEWRHVQELERKRTAS